MTFRLKHKNLISQTFNLYVYKYSVSSITKLQLVLQY